MTNERKRATGFLVYTTKERATYMNKVQFERAWDQSLTRSTGAKRRLPDPTTALRVIALYGRGT